MARNTRFIAVIGGSDCSDEELKTAEEVGRLIAQKGAVLVCGGLGGVMAAACKGADNAGGTTVGILPGPDRKSANPHVTIPIATNMGEARNAVVVRSADVIIAVGGGYGTLSEIGLALRGGTMVIGLDTWSISRHGRADSSIIRVAKPSDAVDLAFELTE